MADAKRAEPDAVVDSIKTTADLVARARAEHRPKSAEEQIAQLEMIRDLSHDWWAALVIANIGKGTGAARDSYREAVVELDRLRNEGGSGADEKVIRLVFQDD